jgi:outer membrane lipoprotein-sorting protein
MNKFSKILILLLLLSLWFTLGLQAVEQVDAEEIVKKMDELYRSSSSFANMEMEIVTPHWRRTLKLDIWSLGMDQTFIRILAPKKERGIATLRLANEMWNFLPKTDKVMKVPPSLMMGSWMGSDFTNDDLVKEFTFLEDYIFALTEVENAEEGVLYVKCTPKEGLPIIWGHIIIAVKENSYLPNWQKYYDEKGKLMREIVYKDLKKFGNREIPAVMELIPHNKKGNKTIVRYVEATFNIKIDKSIFSLRNLRSRI